MSNTVQEGLCGAMVTDQTWNQWTQVRHKFKHHQGHWCYSFLEEEILPLLLSTGWFQEQIHV